ncbi:hypothetical protein J5N97_010322 [Dioscorea zingiberensis]|uniref:Uncharacterized protein n=1 Tax=Dioscorea zingiberensis TaxID=325984 RepID=A0A9D5HNH6_9LILI|nr:hypothetical protein J5N97_010322 [Dioscorea zingiberensis]
MDDLYSWLTNLPFSSDWPASEPCKTLTLAGSTNKSILLKADRTAGSNTETLVTFSILLLGFHPSNPNKTLWISNPCPLSSPLPPLLLHLLQEVISLAPSPPLPSPPKLQPNAISSALSIPNEAPAFLKLVFLCRLFWLCARDAPAEAGFLLFRTLDEPTLDSALACKRAAGAFLAALGPDWEQRFMRSLGYLLAKWLVLRELQPGVAEPLPRHLRGLSYAVDSHGLWVLKAYVPVPAMQRLGGPAAEDSAIRYSLAHQQLEAVVQLEYAVCLRDPRFIRIELRVDNIRVHVVRLGYKEDDDVDVEARHVPTRVRVLVGPEVGSGYVTGPSLGRSTSNPEREIESTRMVKGRVGKGGAELRAKARTCERARVKRWKWEQEADGCAGVYEGVLCDGADVAGGRDAMRIGGARRGLVVAGDEVAEGVTWRAGKEMEGRVVTWRVGLKIWVSYFGEKGINKSGCFETRCEEWTEEVDLALVPFVN